MYSLYLSASITAWMPDVCVTDLSTSRTSVLTSEDSQEERSGRGRAVRRSPESSPSLSITPEDSNARVHTSQVSVLL